jgi:hypothetical protein
MSLSESEAGLKKEKQRNIKETKSPCYNSNN